MFETALLLVIAGLPGLFAWWSGRGLARALDDPLLNERYFARGRRITLITIVAMVVVAVAEPEWALASVPLVFSGTLIGSFPSRRVLLEEDWGLGGYLSHQVRLLVGMFGPWMLLLTGPLVFLAWPQFALPFSVPYLAGLATWGIWGGPVLLRLLRARPLADGTLLSACAPVLDAATCPTPELMVTEPGGSRWANAFAVPRLGIPVVLFTHGLLRDLDLDEVRAILGHELAHLEEFAGGRWLRRALAPAVLGLGLVIALGASRVISPWIAWLFPIALLVALSVLGGRVQRRETESDLRAVALSGDAEALARGLEKIHARARMPRRLDAETEARLSHPSLARRIQEIRAAGTHGDVEPAEVEDAGVEPLCVRAHRPAGTVLVLTQDRLHCFENAPEHLDTLEALQAAASGRSFPYGTLRELRVEARGTGRFLVMRAAAGGRRERFEIGPERVRQVQSWLDRVDVRLGSGHAGRSAGRREQLARLAGAISAFVAALVGAYGFVLASLAVLLRPRRPILWIAGVSGAVAAVGALLGGRTALLEVGSTRVSAALAGAAALVVVALAERMERTDPGAGSEDGVSELMVASLGLFAVALALLQLANVPAGSFVMGLHLWARDLPEPLGLLAGSGVGLLLLRRRLARTAGLLALALAALTAATGTTVVRGRSGDLLADQPPGVSAERLERELLRTVTVEGSVSTVRVDPTTGALLVGTYVEHADFVADLDYRVESALADGGWRDVEADELGWGGVGELVGLVGTEGAVFVEDPDGEDRREQRLGRLLRPELHVLGSEWTVIDHAEDESSLTVYRGQIAGPAEPRPDGSGAARDTGLVADPLAGPDPSVRIRTVAVPADRGLASVAATERALVFSLSAAERTWPFSMTAGAWPMTYAVAVAPEGVSAATVLEGSTAMSLDCREGAAGIALCVAHSTTRTEVWGIDPAGGRPHPIASMRGWHWAEPATEGVILDDYRAAPKWVSGDRGEVRELPVKGHGEGGAPGDTWRQALDVAGDLMAVAWTEGERSRIEVYRLRAPAAADPGER